MDIEVTSEIKKLFKVNEWKKLVDNHKFFFKELLRAISVSSIITLG